MSMSTHVVGFIPPDADWRKHKAAWDACLAAGVPIPKEVLTFFGGEDPDESGREVSLRDILREWGDDSRSGYELDVSKLPPEVKVLRFYNSW